MFARLVLRRLAQQPLRTVTAIVGVAAGVALTAGVTIAQSSIKTSMASYSTTLSGPATLRVEGPVDHGGLDAAALPRIAAAEGVASAVPVVLAVTIAVNEAGEERFIAALGVDCSIEAIVGAFGCADLTAASPDVLRVVLPPRLAAELGPGGIIRSDDGDVALAGVPTLPQLDDANGGNIAIFDITEAQRLFARPAGYDAVFVVPEPGTDPARLRAAVAEAAGPTAAVLDPESPMVDLDVLSQLLLGLLLTSLLALTIGAQLVYNTLTLSFEERRRELAVVAAVGATPATVARGILAEAAVIGITGGLAGAALGTLIAATFVRDLSSQAERVSGIHLDTQVTATSIGIAALIGLVAAVLAAIHPARRAARLDLAAELSDRSPEPATARRRTAQIVVFGGLTAISVVASWIASRGGPIETWQPVAAMACLVVGGTCAFRLPGLVAPVAVGALSHLTGRGTGLTRVAVGNLQGDPRRTSSLATALAGAIGLAVALGGIVPALEDGARQMAQISSAGRVLVATIPLNNGAGVDASLSAEEEGALAAVPGVAAVQHQLFGQLRHGGDLGEVGLLGTDGPAPPFPVYEGEDAATAYAAGHVMIGPALARNQHLRPGNRFSVPGSTGMVELTVGGIWGAPDGLGANIGMDAEQFEAVAGDRPASYFLLQPAPGVSVSELASRVQAAGIRSDLQILTPDALGAVLADEFGSFTSPFRALQRGLLVVAFTATASTMLLTGVQRRREHALLGAVGMAPRSLGMMTLVEAAVIGAIATVTGTLAGYVGTAGFAWASGVLTGLRIGIHLVVVPALVAGAAVTAVALVGAALPAWRTSRIDPAMALRYE